MKIWFFHNKRDKNGTKRKRDDNDAFNNVDDAYTAFDNVNVDVKCWVGFIFKIFVLLETSQCNKIQMFAPGSWASVDKHETDQTFFSWENLALFRFFLWSNMRIWVLHVFKTILKACNMRQLFGLYLRHWSKDNPTPRIRDSSSAAPPPAPPWPKKTRYGVSQWYGVSLCYGVSPCYGVNPCYGVSPC